MIVDVHAHLDHAQFEDDLDEVIKRAEEAGVIAIISNGINPSTNRKVLELSEKYGIVKPALGIYPSEALAEEIKKLNMGWKVEKFRFDEEIKFIEDLAKNKRIIAIGEIGLDDHSAPGTLDKQVPVFEKLLEAAKNTDMPVIVHTRNAEKLTIDILEALKMKKVILHCFSGDLELVKRAEQLGYYFSIPPIVVRDRHFQELIRQVSISKLLTETDSPYLGPYQGKRNEPAFIAETIKVIAKIKNLTEEETKNLIFMNYQTLFFS